MDKRQNIVFTAEDRASAVVKKINTEIGDLSGRMGKFGSLMAGLPTLFAGLGGLAAGREIAAFVNSTLDAADNLAKLSQKLGISVEDLAGFEHAAKLSGLSMEQFTQGSKQLSKFMVESSDKLKAAGITATDAKGALLQLAGAFEKMPDGPKKTAIAMELFGKAGADMIPMLNAGTKALQASIAEGQKFNPVTTEMAKRAEEFNDTMERLSKTFKGLAVDAIKPYVGEMESMAKSALGATQSIGGLYDLLVRMQQLTKSGPLSVFGAGATATQIAALAGVGGDESKRLSVGRIGAKLEAQGSTANLAKVLDKPITAKAVKAAKEPPGGSIFAAAQQSFLAGESGRSASDIMAEFRAEDAALESLRQKYVAMADPLQKYRDELDEINRLRNEGVLTADQALQAEWSVNDALDAARDKMAGLSDATQLQTNLARDLGLTFSSAFEDMLVSGGKVRDMLEAIGKDALRLLARKNITEPFANAISSTDWSKIFSFNALGGVYSGAGISAYSGSVVSRPTVFPFASGIGLMGEAGPEAILPLKRGSNGKLGVEGGGGNVVVNVNNNAAGTQATARERNEGGMRIIDVMIERVEVAIASNVTSGRGPMAGALSSTYGLNRAAGSY